MLYDTINLATWQDRALCKNYSPDIFFKKGNTNLARQICGSCPVNLLCHDWILELEKDGATATRQGIYAGMTPNQRRKIIWCSLKDCKNRVKKRATFCSEEHKKIHTDAVTERRKALKRKAKKEGPY
jgi:hypothetical protein